MGNNYKEGVSSGFFIKNWNGGVQYTSYIQAITDEMNRYLNHKLFEHEGKTFTIGHCVFLFGPLYSALIAVNTSSYKLNEDSTITPLKQYVESQMLQKQITVSMHSLK